MRGALSLLLALSYLLNGCTSWKTQEVAPATYIQSNRPERVRLTLQDSTRLTLQSPTVAGDSIVGFVGHAAPQAVAQSDVRSFEAYHPNTLNSVALAVGIAAGAFLVVLGIWAITCEGCFDGS